MADYKLRIIVSGEDQASKIFAGVGSSLDNLSSKVSAVGAGMMSAGTKLTAGVTAPILGFAAAAIKAAADQEQLETSFTTMLGSAEAAKDMMADLAQFAAATPFESPEIQNASKMLLAFGVSAEDIIPTMTNLGDIAAGLNIPIGEMAYLFGTTKAAGRMMTADLNQFTSRGIPMISALAKTMGVAESDVKGLVEAGKVGFPEMEAALKSLTGEGGQFEDLMEAQSLTLAGLFSTLKDNVGQALTVVGQQIIDTFDLKTKLGDAIVWLESMKNSLISFAETNPKLFRLGIIIAGVAAAIGPLLIGVGLLVSWMGAALPVIGAIGGALGLLLSPLGLIAAAIAAAFYFDVGGIRSGFMSVLASAQEMGQGVLTALKPLIDGADFSVLKTNITGAFADIGSAISDYFSGNISLGGLASAVSEGFTKIRDSISAFFGGADFGQFLTDIKWAEFIKPLTWDNVISKLTSWGTYITSLDWTKIITTALDWSTWIFALNWALFVTVIDWGAYIISLAWDGFVKLLDWATVAGDGITWNDFIDVLDWVTAIGEFTWESFITKLEWLGVIDKLTSWSDYIMAIDWGSYITAIDWSAGVITALDWASYVFILPWNLVVSILDWATYVDLLDWSTTVTAMTDWGAYIIALDWAGYITGALSWASYVGVIAWGNFVDKLNWPSAVKNLTWDSYLEKIGWTSFVTKMSNWGTYITSLTWSDFVTALSDWASFITSLSWADFVTSINLGTLANPLRWASFITGIDLSSYIPEFPGWAAFVGGVKDAASSLIPGNATGTNYFRGGLSWVGETGPELVRLPRGSEVMSTRRSAFAGDGTDREVTVINNNFYNTIHNPIDINKLAYQVAAIQARRR